MSGLIWVQTVWKNYQQKTLAGKEFIVKTSSHVSKKYHAVHLDIAVKVLETVFHGIKCKVMH